MEMMDLSDASAIVAAPTAQDKNGAQMTAMRVALDLAHADLAESELARSAIESRCKAAIEALEAAEAQVAEQAQVMAAGAANEERLLARLRKADNAADELRQRCATYIEQAIAAGKRADEQLAAMSGGGVMSAVVIDAGGPAYPTVDANSEADYGSKGMTLRDYFAGIALPDHVGDFEPEDAARLAYCYADAMLKERKK